MLEKDRALGDMPPSLAQDSHSETQSGGPRHAKGQVAAREADGGYAHPIPVPVFLWMVAAIEAVRP